MSSNPSVTIFFLKIILFLVCWLTKMTFSFLAEMNTSFRRILKILVHFFIWKEIWYSWFYFFNHGGNILFIVSSLWEIWQNQEDPLQKRWEFVISEILFCCKDTQKLSIIFMTVEKFLCPAHFSKSIIQWTNISILIEGSGFGAEKFSVPLLCLLLIIFFYIVRYWFCVSLWILSI